jgi:predicted site-specific integrase-resolvase
MDPRKSHETAEPATASPFLTPREVRRRLNISRATLDTWCTTGAIEFIRLPSGHRRYPVEDVERIARGAKAGA